MTISLSNGLSGLQTTILLRPSDIWVMKPLPLSFYHGPDVVKIAQALLGKLLITRFGGMETVARIVETEAYKGVVDRASHAYGGRRTQRTEVMFAEGGVAYVYLCYGIHHLFNIVTNRQGIPHAVLVRAVEPLAGLEHMLERRGRTVSDAALTRGPGSVSRAMGITIQHTGLSLQDEAMFLAEDGYVLRSKEIISTPRIGVDYAGIDAALPYRFFLKDNPYVSGSKAFNYAKT
jgi:DNA-3-methyladenine glycosylase